MNDVHNNGNCAASAHFRIFTGIPGLGFVRTLNSTPFPGIPFSEKNIILNKGDTMLFK